MVEQTARRWALALTLPLVLVISIVTGTNFVGPAAAKAVAPLAPSGALPVADYEALLQRYVDDQGRVDYATLKSKDAATVDRLYAALTATGPDQTPALYPTRDAALAYYLSAYNILVWKNLLDRLPSLKRVDAENFRFFRDPKFLVDGKELDLDTLEKQLIRPRFKDPRIHFALNCASGGCPKLPRSAFTAATIHQQLDTESRRFCTEPRNVRYDASHKTATLSMIFKWYADDFGGNPAAVLAFINKYRAPEQQLPAGTQLEYADYDWRLNDKSLPPR